MDVRDDFHGSDGPVPVRRVPLNEWLPIYEAFHRSALDAGFPYDPDMNNPETTGTGETINMFSLPPTQIREHPPYSPSRSRISVHSLTNRSISDSRNGLSKEGGKSRPSVPITKESPLPVLVRLISYPSRHVLSWTRQRNSPSPSRSSLASMKAHGRRTRRKRSA